MLGELRATDRLSTHRSFDDGRIRLVSMCAMGCEPPTRAGARTLSLFVEPVELLASSRWLLTYRHPARRIDGREEAGATVSPPSRGQSCARASLGAGAMDRLRVPAISGSS